MNNKHFKTSLLITILCLSTMPLFAYTKWAQSGAAICTAAGSWYEPELVGDGAGGAIISWGGADLSAQRINRNGVVQWATNGVSVCTASGNQLYPEMIPDGTGGAIIVWTDTRNGNSDIFAQRINSSGVSQWTANGVAICTATGEQTGPAIISDLSGGAIIAWTDARSGTKDVYAQKISSTGVVQWATNGVTVCTASGDQNFTGLVADGNGGAVLCWDDQRSIDWNVYVQKINSSGVSQWTIGGVVICNATSEQYDSRIISDGSGGAIITWYDYRNLTDGNIYCQRVSNGGVIQWATNWVCVCSQSANQQTPRITSDGANGAIITWVDPRNDGNGDIYAQKINSGGTVQWTTDGVGVCKASGNQARMEILGDGNGGATIIWDDDIGANIAAQKINSSGVAMWPTNGIWVCNNAGSQHRGHLISDGSGGQIITWDDDRSGYLNIYAQKIGDNPVVSSISPNTYTNSGTINITNLSGSGFSPLSTVKLTKAAQADIVATSVSAVTDVKITCVFDITGRATGLWNVSVADTDAEVAVLSNGFNVTTPAPTVIGLSLKTSTNNTSVSINVSGSGFFGGIGSSTVTAVNLGATLLTSYAVTSDSTLTGLLIPSGIGVGIYDLTVTALGGTSATTSDLAPGNWSTSLC